MRLGCGPRSRGRARTVGEVLLAAAEKHEQEGGLLVLVAKDGGGERLGHELDAVGPLAQPLDVGDVIQPLEHFCQGGLHKPNTST